MGSTHSNGPILIGRYALFDAIASGGMATVHLGRLMGEVGFSRTVAIKRLHSQHAMDPEFVSMFIDEARLAARVRHPNVVQTLDVGATDGELFVVMDYIEGESLSRMFRLAVETGMRIDPRIVSRVMTDTLQGLHAAHDAKAEDGTPLEIVHRDVSPQNVLVGTDGISRVLDFGIAKAAGRGQTTKEGQIKGKLAYMAPEQLMGEPVTRRTDVFAAGVVLWELLVGRRLFAGSNEGEVVRRVLELAIAPPRSLVPDLPPAIDAVVLRALARDPNARFASAAELADALDAAIPPATARAVGEWIRSRADATLTKRAALVAHIERSSSAVRPTDLAGRRSDPTIVDPGALDVPVDVATAMATSQSVTQTHPKPPVALLVGLSLLLTAGIGGIVLVRMRAHVTPPTTTAAASSAAPVASAPIPEPPPVPPETATQEASATPVPSAAPSSSAKKAATNVSSPRLPTQHAPDPKPSATPKGGLYTRD